MYGQLVEPHRGRWEGETLGTMGGGRTRGEHGVRRRYAALPPCMEIAHRSGAHVGHGLTREDFAMAIGTVGRPSCTLHTGDSPPNAGGQNQKTPQL